jgi:hypothetical protein
MRGNGLLAIRIRSIPDLQKKTSSSGANPFDSLAFFVDGEQVRFQEYKTNGWNWYTSRLVLESGRLIVNLLLMIWAFNLPAIVTALTFAAAIIATALNWQRSNPEPCQSNLIICSIWRSIRKQTNEAP